MWNERLISLEKELEEQQQELEQTLSLARSNLNVFSSIMEYQVKEVFDREEERCLTFK